MECCGTHRGDAASFSRRRLGMVCTSADFALFPFTLGYLLLYAGWVHARRKVRLAMRGGV